MSEMLKWAEKFVKKANDMSTPVSAGLVDSHLYGLACAILADADPSNADTSPASPERDEGPSGGEGAPEPDGWREAWVWEQAISVVKEVAARGHFWQMQTLSDAIVAELREIQSDRLPPEREAEAREPDGWAETDAPDLNRQGDRWHSRKGRSSLYTVPVYFGTPGPDREAEDGLEAAVSLMADREAEIRADERMNLRRAESEQNKPLADFLAGEIVRHLECLDAIGEIHPESPNRSDEP